jgi:hypothetical protein
MHAVRSTILAAATIMPLILQSPAAAQSQQKNPPTVHLSLTELIGTGYEIKSGTVTRKYVGILLQKGANVVICEADVMVGGTPTTTQCETVR